MKQFSKKRSIDLYHIIREGNLEEAEAAISELQDRESNIRRNSIRGMAVAIMARNNSHGIGTIAKTVAKANKKRRPKATGKKNKKQ